MEKVRGSDKLWERLADGPAPKAKELASALSLTGGDYVIRRWWKYGQPAIDRITGVVDVPLEGGLDFLGSILKLHGEKLQVTIEVFPYGIPFPDIWRVNLGLERALGR
jgi:hypothetical protein